MAKTRCYFIRTASLLLQDSMIAALTAEPRGHIQTQCHCAPVSADVGGRYAKKDKPKARGSIFDLNRDAHKPPVTTP